MNQIDIDRTRSIVAEERSICHINKHKSSSLRDLPEDVTRNYDVVRLAFVRTRFLSPEAI